ncbi:hypothetical protein EVAR_16019_1 [Eumeta japonica]|uniref:Uncharacterized protein n=1 Tax=Eumeta variegata TaxID=151549 RepID=A0A4C1W050_EUMVA|nr:hypothetical protein EVAR_16019_1 [Eumeta japonica]
MLFIQRVKTSSSKSSKTQLINAVFPTGLNANNSYEFYKQSDNEALKALPQFVLPFAHLPLELLATSTPPIFCPLHHRRTLSVRINGRVGSSG